MGGARERFGGSGVIVLADDRRLAAQSARNRRLATLEGIDHIHLREGQPQQLDEERERERAHETGRRGLEKLQSLDRGQRLDFPVEAAAVEHLRKPLVSENHVKGERHPNKEKRPP